VVGCAQTVKLCALPFWPRGAPRGPAGAEGRSAGCLAGSIAHHLSLGDPSRADAPRDGKNLVIAHS